MKMLGKVLHLSKSGKLILRSKITVRPRINVLSVKQKIVGRIFDIFGPVNNPYISITPSVSNPDHYVNLTLYILK